MATETETRAALIVGAVVPFAVIALVTILAVWEGWVITKLWLWHFVPLGLPALPLGAAVAGDMIVSILTLHLRPEPVVPQSKWWKGPLVSGAALVVGWLLKVMA
jgi:hypothetical protein